MQSLEKTGDMWEIILFLERPEFWGEDLKLLKDDISAIVVHYQDRVESATNLVDFG